jgi:hypothetical protein
VAFIHDATSAPNGLLQLIILITMKQSVVKKPVISPFLFTVFAAVAVTGVLLFVDVKNGPITVIHEWLGIVFVIAGLLHIILNFRQFLSYFKLTRAWIGVVLGLALIGFFAFAGFGHHGGPHGRPGADAPQSGQAE